jgi:predicted HAD superfamily Cof-like phosphohydrolase
MSHLKQAYEFRALMEQAVDCPCLSHAKLQGDLIDEECCEFACALEEVKRQFFSSKRTNEACLKELADLVYVCYQFAASFGWDLDEALDRVHESNLSKLVDGKPLRREDGKILKGPNYQPPSLIDLV